MTDLDQHQVFTLVVQILVLVLLAVNVQFSVVRMRRLRQAGRPAPGLLKASLIAFAVAMVTDLFLIVLTLTGI